MLVARILYTFYTEQFGEVDAFFDEKFKMITCFNCNDATYRGEYMEELFTHFGIKVASLPKVREKYALKCIKKTMGL